MHVFSTHMQVFRTFFAVLMMDLHIQALPGLTNVLVIRSRIDGSLHRFICGQLGESDNRKAVSPRFLTLSHMAVVPVRNRRTFHLVFPRYLDSRADLLHRAQGIFFPDRYTAPGPSRHSWRVHLHSVHDLLHSNRLVQYVHHYGSGIRVPCRSSPGDTGRERSPGDCILGGFDRLRSLSVRILPGSYRVSCAFLNVGGGAVDTLCCSL